MWDDGCSWTYGGKHATICVNHTILLNPLNLVTYVNNFLNKTGEEGKFFLFFFFTCESESVTQSVQSFGTPWAAARQAPQSLLLPRQEYWSG